MSFSFLAPVFLWTLLGIPIVVALHFIRARKKRYEVSSLFLWQQAKEMAQTRRRFSASWLLALQLLFVTLAALALAQPSFRFAGRPERVFIVDTSASMAAQDSDGVRLDKAVSEARRLGRGAGQAALVRAGLDATVSQALTNNRGELNRALDALSAADEEANLERAISLARSLAPDAELHVFSDSDVPNAPDISVHAVGGDAQNVGVSTFDIGLGQAFVAVVSNHPRPQEIGVELLQEGQVLASTTLLVPARGQSNTLFPLGEASGFFEVRLNVPDWDALELDNSAYAGRRTLQAVLNQPQAELERALSSIPDLNYQVLPNADPSAPGFDVKILVGSLTDPSAENISGNLLLIAPSAENVDFQTVRSWDRSDPLLRFVDLSEAVVGVNLDTPNRYPDWQILAQTGDLNPVLQRLETDSAKLVALNVYPTQTDVVNRTAFPLLLTNIVNSFRDEARLSLGEPLPAGSTLLGEDEALGFVTQAGLYDLNGETYSASLLSATESRLPVAEVESEATRTQSLSARVQSVALWLVGIATIALLLEWLLWSRSNGKWRFGLGRE